MQINVYFLSNNTRSNALNSFFISPNSHNKAHFFLLRHSFIPGRNLWTSWRVKQTKIALLRAEITSETDISRLFFFSEIIGSFLTDF